jgi:Methyladenine glycosylase
LNRWSDERRLLPNGTRSPGAWPLSSLEYGFPASDEGVLFERLMLEINQAGLSWLTILNKRAAFRAAYADFEVDRVAAFGPAEFERLMADPGIVRNRLKIEGGDRKCAPDPGAARDTRLVCRLARCAPPALSRSLDIAVPQALPLHRRADRRRVSDQPRLPARRARG